MEHCSCYNQYIYIYQGVLNLISLCIDTLLLAVSFNRYGSRRNSSILANSLYLRAISVQTDHACIVTMITCTGTEPLINYQTFVLEPIS